jgi:hypothetical protein
MRDDEISEPAMCEVPANRHAVRLQPSASYSFTMRLHMPQHGGAFARIARAIADADATLGRSTLCGSSPSRLSAT